MSAYSVKFGTLSWYVSIYVSSIFLIYIFLHNISIFEVNFITDINYFIGVIISLYVVTFLTNIQSKCLKQISRKTFDKIVRVKNLNVFHQLSQKTSNKSITRTLLVELRSINNLFLLLILLVVYTLLNIEFGPIFHSAVITLIVSVCAYMLYNKSIIEEHSINNNSTNFYKELVLLSGIVIGSLVIQFYNIGGLPPYPDEYNHLIAARDMLDGNIVPDYTRSYLLVTVPTFISFILFDSSLAAGRLSVAFLSSLAIVPMYYLLKRINQEAAIFGVLLYATNPWNIAVSRTIREYALFPLLSCVLALMFLYVLDEFDRNQSVADVVNVLQKSTKLQITLIFLAFFPLYLLFIDDVSATRVLLFLYVVFGAFFAYKILQKLNVPNQLKYILTLIIGILGFLAGLYNSGNLSIIPTYNQSHFVQVLDLFINNPETQWYHDIGSYFMIMLFSIGCLYSLLSKNTTAKFILLAFGLQFYMLMFHWERYFRPRYGFFIQIWFILIISVGIGVISQTIQNKLSNLTIKFEDMKIDKNLIKYVLVAFLLVTLLINPSQIYMSAALHESESWGGTYVPITNEYHPDADEGLAPVQSHANTTDYILIDSKNYLEWYYPDILSNNTVKEYSCDQDNKLDIMEENNVIIATKARNRDHHCIDDLNNTKQISLQGRYFVFSNFETDRN